MAMAAFNTILGKPKIKHPAACSEEYDPKRLKYNVGGATCVHLS